SAVDGRQHSLFGSGHDHFDGSRGTTVCSGERRMVDRDRRPVHSGSEAIGRGNAVGFRIQIAAVVEPKGRGCAQRRGVGGRLRTLMVVKPKPAFYRNAGTADEHRQDKRGDHEIVARLIAPKAVKMIAATRSAKLAARVSLGTASHKA